MPIREIPRTKMPSREDFLRDFAYHREPVVITDLFAGQEVSEVKTVEDAVRVWGDVGLVVQEEYTSAEGKAAPAEPRVMSLRDYVDFSRSNPSTRLCCTEYDTPAHVLASFELPDICQVTHPGEEILGLPKKYGDYDLVTAIFLANAGNVGHLHFDGDQRDVILHQVYGRKRVVLFPPAAAKHLRTLDGPYSRPSLAGVYLEDMSLEEKLDWVERAGGYHTVLEPGETVYIPMLMWHHLEYMDDAMSFNYRFGRTRYGRFLSVDNFHRDPYIQNVAAKMVGPEDVLRNFEPVVDEIATAYVQPATDVQEKVREVRALFRRLCAEVSPEADPEALCPPEREEEQVARIAQGNDMKGGLKYEDPALIARTRPTGGVDERQREMLESGARRAGYPDEVMRTVLRNRLGKEDVDELTKAEAAQLVAYLASPGAAW
ncbi:MAG TPA: cupin-like domain-containing protein [Solirubrobacterales bacterium]|nr:cupin-like domain-containing protein [Solirubrobacterales bacterium]